MHRASVTLLFSLALAACGTGAIAASSVTASPATLDARLRQAHDGEVITLAPGDYGLVTVPQRSHAKPVVLDAAKATFSGIVIRKADGIAIRGGTVVAPGGKSYGIAIDRASHVTIDGMKITGAHRGVVVNMSSDIALTNNQLTGLISDGIDIALSRRMVVSGNSCRDFNPIWAVYDAAGKRLRDGDHPDCIQAWSRPTAPPSADIVVTGNDIEVTGQGIFFGNHVRNGVDDGGFDRIRIENNKVRVGLPRGITLGNGRDSVVRNNDVSTIPGSVLPNNGRPVHANIEVTGTGNLVCGNRVPAVPRNPATRRCD